MSHDAAATFPPQVSPFAARGEDGSASTVARGSSLTSELLSSGMIQLKMKVQPISNALFLFLFSSKYSGEGLWYA